VAGVPAVLGLGGPGLVLAPVVLAGILLGGLVAVLGVWARLQGARPVPASERSTRVPAGR
jgi:hypothetical protein